MEDNNDNMGPPDGGNASFPTVSSNEEEDGGGVHQTDPPEEEDEEEEENGRRHSDSFADFQDSEENMDDMNEADMDAEGGSSEGIFPDEIDDTNAEGSGEGDLGDVNDEEQQDQQQEQQQQEEEDEQQQQQEEEDNPSLNQLNNGNNKKKRLCRTPGCNRVIKSQGHCQRHGAKAKRCKVAGCDKQAQGTHDGMCKRHWKAVNFPETVAAQAPKEESVPPPPEGISVYDGVLPRSIAYRPTVFQKHQVGECSKVNGPENPPPPQGEMYIMPLVTFLRQGSNKEPGWHRNAERRARGMFPCTSLSSQLEPWERQLCLVEILLLSGGTPYANFKDLSHAWGRERGFHNILTSSVCERRGEVDRKRRSDVGKKLTNDQREAFRQKLQRTRSSLEQRAEAIAAAAGGGGGNGSDGGDGQMQEDPNDQSNMPMEGHHTQQAHHQQQQQQRQHHSVKMEDAGENDHDEAVGSL
eukprot:scaffold318_cov110-Cylindrotheca_fusiformis.AAC.10